MANVRVLDCTLRDGGCVNDFDFGDNNIRLILDSLEHSKVDIVECGYIDCKYGMSKGRTKFDSERTLSRNYLVNRNHGEQEYVAMVDLGKYDLNKLSMRCENGLDGIRLAFHKEQIDEAIISARIILDKGYDLYIQPMITIRYSDKELLDLIEKVNLELPETKALYLVDSFGEMRMNDVSRIINIYDHNLKDNIALGFHSHNNMQLSYPNAVQILEKTRVWKRDVIIDASIMGMGKGAGNLCTEIICDYLNQFYNKNYNLIPVLKIIDELLLQIYEEYRWGYSIEYYLSAVTHCSPSYASFFFNKHTMTVEMLKMLLERVEQSKRISFDKEYAEGLYEEFNYKETNNELEVLEKLEKEIKNKDVVLIAPGKRLSEAKEDIQGMYNEKDKYLLISLNAPDIFSTQYALVTKNGVLCENMKCENLIITSNVSEIHEEKLTVNYNTWINKGDDNGDASIVIALNLLDKMKCKKIIMAGFDGFTTSIGQNYIDKKYGKRMSPIQVKNRNEYIKSVIKEKQKKMTILFITKSIYDSDN